MHHIVIKYKKTIYMVLAMAIVLLCCPTQAEAVVNARPLGGEDRIKIINYIPNSVYKYTGHYMYQSIIEFGLDEEIKTISMGTPTPWQIVPSGNRIFLKPVEDNATTNMTVITNKRMYFFEMHAEEAVDINDEDLSFIVKFIYPDEAMTSARKFVNTSTPYPGLDGKKYNQNYVLGGGFHDIEPLRVFDDGRFTYFKFKDINAEVPAIFYINDEHREALINYRIESDYLVVERVAKIFVLRQGKAAIYVYNQNLLGEVKKSSEIRKAKK